MALVSKVGEWQLEFISYVHTFSGWKAQPSKRLALPGGNRIFGRSSVALDCGVVGFWHM